MRVSAGSHGVGKALDGELAQLVRRAGLTSAQTDAVIPGGTAPSLAARVRRNPNSAVTPPPPDATFPSFPVFTLLPSDELPTSKSSARSTALEGLQGASVCFSLFLKGGKST